MPFGRKRKLPELINVDEEDIRNVKIADIEVDYQIGCDDDTIILEEGEDLDGTYLLASLPCIYICVLISDYLLYLCTCDY